MKTGLGRLLGQPFIWAFAWAIPGGVIEALSNIGVQLSFANNVDMWPQTLAIPGFVAGLLFSALIAAAGRARSFETWSLGLLAGLGMIVGLITGGIIMAVDYIGGTPTEFAFTTVMGGVAAITSALLFRHLARRRVRATA